MPGQLDEVSQAFSADTELSTRVLRAAQQNHDQLQLFVDIARYIRANSQHSQVAVPAIHNGSNKRKAESTIPGNEDVKLKKQCQTSSSPVGPIAIIANDISVSIPVRKKLQVQFLDTGSRTGGLVICNPADSSILHEFSWRDIAHAFLLPVPEKAQAASTFVVLLHPETDLPERQFAWTIAANANTSAWEVAETSLAGETACQVMTTALERGLATVSKTITKPLRDEFASTVVQGHRRDETAFHVKAHIGSKDGYLYFLPSGIFYGFRKPLLFYAFDAIESISYTSVLQRTFNLVITTSISTPPSDDQGTQPASTTDIEFSMLDQSDFAGIDEYIKRHGLNDASMAKVRRAEKFHVNRAKDADQVDDGREGGDRVKSETGEDDEGSETELQKAERQLQDQEDEEEEDYDPGSEGESEDEEGRDGNASGQEDLASDDEER